ncbi:MAG TPA: sulfate adenylyltransferase [Sedimenticola thiotaurini]|uniref:Sulfate adenylyltransferase n=1 Tax=Sedimenticola thiotaurini TaxID=1543721 RepID=A0A831W8R3_9GAMM|nr:sulfate adenylyltransferase [Sedimenticola thiotaurini]
MMKWVEQKYGRAAAERVDRWRNLMASERDLPERDKLTLVNAFFNRLPWKTDQELWGREDYWATPIEALSIRGADCEDYSIAKYFTLRELGVPDSKLKIMYVKALRLNQAHMVLTYYPTPDAVPLVLDNINGDILPASERPDLAPVYSFNASSLWLAKRRGEGRRVGGSDRLSLWQDLQQRLQREGEQHNDR